MSYYLLFDIGNTRLKWAAVESSHHPADQQKKLWAYSGSINNTSLSSPEHREELANYISKTLPDPLAIGFTCVAGKEILKNLKSLFPQWNDIEWQELLGDKECMGLRTLYQEPSKLGADRWAAIIGARALKNVNSLVINAGTATTIDLLGANGVHYGGWILPGLELMQKSLTNNTAQLPLVTREDINNSFGLTTNQAIVGGCDAAQIGAIQYAISLSKEINLPIEKIWFDGGNAVVLAKEFGKTKNPLSQHVEITEGLVLRGIWSWLAERQKD